MAQFQLRKWYFDLVTEEGTTFIGYIARLRWGLFSWSYSGVHLQSQKQLLLQASSSRNSELPQIEGDVCTIKSPLFEGTWRRIQPKVERELLQTYQGSLRWSCHIPHAQAEVTVPGNGKFHGMGYVEELVSTIPIWQLPIRELQWGRVLTKKDSIIWMRWLSDTHPLSLVWSNGQVIHHFDFQPYRLAMPEQEVILLDHQVLIEGFVLEQHLSCYPWLLWLVPRTFRRFHESKKLSRATLTQSGDDSHGWAIHESVTWT